jgi:type IV secretion system protein TrbE
MPNDAKRSATDSAESFAEMLPWSHLSNSGLCVTKDGQYLAGFYFRPPDTDSAIDEDSDRLAYRMNEACKVLGTGWATWTDVVSFQAGPYPAAELSHFPDPYSRAVDEERRKRFQAEGAHYENDRAFIVCYTPPRVQVSKLGDLFYNTNEEDSPLRLQNRIAAAFEATLQAILNQVGRDLGMRRMQSFVVRDADGNEHLQDELVNYLNFCASGVNRGVALPSHGGYLDGLISCQDIHTAERPVIGQDYIGVVSIDGFPMESTANVISRLNTMGMPYRFTQRMIYLDPNDAVKELGKYRAKWGQKVRGMMAIVLQSKDGPINEFALEMKQEADRAISTAERRDVLFGYYSPSVILRHRDPHVLKTWLDEVSDVIQSCQYGARIEETNTMEAWRGGLPGDIRHNIRAPLIHTLNATHLMPLTGVWTGNPEAPCPLYPQPAPALMYGHTTGSIPFRMNIHCGASGDVGHTLIFGPSGNGKSTLTNLIAMQARRYKGMKITAFDNKFGMMATALACGGRHYDLSTAGSDHGLYCPLAHLDSEQDIAWANDYMSLLYEFQNDGKPPPQELRGPIHRAILHLADNPSDRSLTAFIQMLQNTHGREVFKAYTEGALGSVLDGQHNDERESSFDVFECEHLMELGQAYSMPVLLHQFHQFERSLGSGRPSLLFIAEAWNAFGHPMWKERLASWLRRLRSKNCSVIMDTQSLADVVKSNMLTLLNENCPRKIFLPNSSAKQKGSVEYYSDLGLNDNQINIIQAARPKEHYYVTGPDGARLTSFDMSRFELAVAGATSADDVQLIKRLYATHADGFLQHLLAAKGIDHPLAKEAHNVALAA